MAVVATGVSCAGAGVCERVFLHDQGIQLAQDSQPGSLAGSAKDSPLDAGQRQPITVLDAQTVETVGHQLSGPGFFEANLRVGQDVLGNVYEFIPVGFKWSRTPFA